MLKHYKALLNTLLWKLTEAETTHKYETRFQSQRASRRSREVKLRYDHVYQRAKMIAKLEEATKKKVDVILKKAFACTVTKGEHKRLSKFDKEYDGWARYRKAKIVVKDTKTGKGVKLR